jgi:hypothetical protein
LRNDRSDSLFGELHVEKGLFQNVDGLAVLLNGGLQVEKELDTNVIKLFTDLIYN